MDSNVNDLQCMEYFSSMNFYFKVKFLKENHAIGLSEACCPNKQFVSSVKWLLNYVPYVPLTCNRKSNGIVCPFHGTGARVICSIK